MQIKQTFPPGSNPEAVDVYLLTPEYEHARQVALTRMAQNKAANTDSIRKAETRNPLHLDLLGATGEKAASVYFRIPWDGNLGDWQAGDVGPCEVRTAGGHHYHLCLYEGKDTNKTHKPYVLATCDDHQEYRTFKLQGWMWGWEIMTPPFWRDPNWPNWSGGPCWLVPPNRLRPIKHLLLLMNLGAFGPEYLHDNRSAEREKTAKTN